MNFLGIGGGLKVFISFRPENDTKFVQLDHIPSWKVRKNPFAHVKRHQKKQGQYNENGVNVETSPYYATDPDQDICGIITIAQPNGKRYDHLGVKVEFVGRISTTAMQTVENRIQYNFITLGKEVAPPGSLYEATVRYPFSFKSVEKPYETYHGRNCHVTYCVRATVERKYLPPVVKEEELVVRIMQVEPPLNDAIKMEVGIEDCLHIEFEYQKKCYHLTDVIVGKIYFLLVKIKIKYMELAVLRRETSGDISTSSGEYSKVAAEDKEIHTETQTLVKYEIMDGAPVKGETVPVRLYLKGIPADLTPTITSSQNNRFAVKYFLNLVLVDEEDRRYFKQQEIILWRKELDS